MRVISRTLAVAGAVGVITLAGPAFAAGPYTVTAGTNTSGFAPFTSASGAIQFTTSGGLNLGCSSGTANGSVRLGTNSNGVAIATITSSSFTNCNGPLGLKLNVTQTRPWKLNATAPAGAVVTGGAITAVGARVADANGQCSFDVVGAVKANFNAPQQKLVIVPSGPKLKISNVQGCFGQVGNGDTAQFGATYAINSPKGKIAIS